MIYCGHLKSIFNHSGQEVLSFSEQKNHFGVSFKMQIPIFHSQELSRSGDSGNQHFNVTEVTPGQELGKLTLTNSGSVPDFWKYSARNSSASIPWEP